MEYSTTIPRQVGPLCCHASPLRRLLPHPAHAVPQGPRLRLSAAPRRPLQCGLSGSSALACAALNCLLRHHGLEAAVPAALRPQLLLEAEHLLGITAGLQDRVVQVGTAARCISS